jgi:kynurenine formamidase
MSDKVQEKIDYVVTRHDIEEWEASYGEIAEGSIVLIHTGWDRFWGSDRFCEPDAGGVHHFPGIAKDASELLVLRNIAAVGIDTMGIDTGIDSQFPAHLALLGAHIPIAENLANLGELPERGANVYLLPMKVQDAPEAPLRAVAIVNLPPAPTSSS